MTVLADQVFASWESAVERGGLVRLGAADVSGENIAELASEQSRRLLWIDSVDATSESELLAAWAESFGFAEEVEREWDSVDDFLADFDVSPDSGLIIVWTGWESIEEEDDAAMAVAVDALRTAATAWSDEGIPWAILVAGEGPAWELPWVGTGTAPWDLAIEFDEFDAGDESETGDGGSEKEGPGSEVYAAEVYELDSIAADPDDETEPTW